LLLCRRRNGPAGVSACLDLGRGVAVLYLMHIRLH
jgi:hypothetical protein